MGNSYYSSASGAAAQGDGNSTITYQSDGVSIAQKSGNTTASVFIPVAAPMDQSAKLQSLSVQCGTSNGGSIQEVTVNFGRQDKQPTLDNAGPYSKDFTVTATTASQVADTTPYGITVTLSLNLPWPSSSVSINSISLEFV